MLDLNLSIFENLLACQELFANTKPSPGVDFSPRRTISNISTLAAQTKANKVYAENLLRRLDGSSVLVSIQLLI